MNRATSPVRILCVALMLCGILSACAPLFVGGTAVTAALVASDRRTAGEQLEDNVIELKIASDVRALFLQESPVRVNATTYAGVVLLTGDVPTQADSQRVEQAASQVEQVKRVVNRLRVGDVTPFSVRSNDSWLTSKVRTNLINTKDVPSSSIVITTERGTVYLMGRVTREEAERSARAAARINGIHQVITLFDVVPHHRIAPSTSPPPAAASAQNAAISPAGAPPAASDDGVQTMAIQ